MIRRPPRPPPFPYTPLFRSSLTVNLAAALAVQGNDVGVLDADVWGYSIPRMLGLGADRPRVNAERRIVPLESHGRSEEHTSELQSRQYLVCRLLLEKTHSGG